MRELKRTKIESFLALYMAMIGDKFRFSFPHLLLACVSYCYHKHHRFIIDFLHLVLEPILPLPCSFWFLVFFLIFLFCFFGASLVKNRIRNYCFGWFLWVCVLNRSKWYPNQRDWIGSENGLNWPGGGWRRWTVHSGSRTHVPLFSCERMNVGPLHILWCYFCFCHPYMLQRFI